MQTSGQVPANIDWLSEAERGILDRFRFPKRSNDWRLGRWTAKQAIRAYLSQHHFLLSSLEIRMADCGAPEPYLDGKTADVSISLSHSRDRSLCAVGPRDIEIGCDLEWVESREGNFAADYFTSEEISLLAHAPVDGMIAVNLIWSAKETVLKILRLGLSRDTRSIIIRPGFSGCGNAWNPWAGRCLESSRAFHGWWRVCDGYIYTIGTDQPAIVPRELSV